jgi:hypothetical protein
LSKRSVDFCAIASAWRVWIRRTYANEGIEEPVTFLRELGYAVRRLRGDYLGTIVIVIQLALAIGANTAIFSLINALLLRSLPVDRPQELVALTTQLNNAETILSYPAFRALRERQDVFSEMTAIQSFFRIERARVSGQTEEIPINGTLVSDSYFTTLEIRPQAGRFFEPAADRRSLSPDAQKRTVVISDGFWQRQCGGRPDALGSALTLAGQAYTIIGVAPKGFTGETIGSTPDAWLLIEHFKTVDELQNRNATFFQVLARMKPDIDHTVPPRGRSCCSRKS